jgi:hypothetical protein
MIASHTHWHRDSQLKALPAPDNVTRVVFGKAVKEYAVLEPYTRRLLLQAVAMYHPKQFYVMKHSIALHQARKAYGTQFLIDLFVISEEMIAHWPKYKIQEMRRDITTCLYYKPDERLHREEGQGITTKKVDYTHIR